MFNASFATPCLTTFCRVPRDTVVRRLAHEPFGHRPTILQVRVRRYRCAHCGKTWRQDTSKAAAPRGKISRGGLGWALTAIVVDHLTVTRVAAGLGVTTIGVDEHVDAARSWRGCANWTCGCRSGSCAVLLTEKRGACVWLRLRTRLSETALLIS